MNATWIVSANASRARFFSQARPSDRPEEISDMVNAAVRLRAAETETDRLGTTAAAKSRHSSGGAAPNKAYEPNKTPVEQEMEAFARSVADFLLKACQEGRFQALTLVVAPQFLGVLRKQLDAKVQALVGQEINKDYTHATPQELQEHLKAHR